MQILYDVQKDLLYIRLDDQKQAVINRLASSRNANFIDKKPPAAWLGGGRVSKT